MNFLRACAISIMIIFCISISGCGGGGAELKSETSTTTLGQELKDLKDAYDKGIITEKEYNNAKKKIIEQRTKN